MSRKMFPIVSISKLLNFRNNVFEPRVFQRNTRQQNPAPEITFTEIKINTTPQHSRPSDRQL